MSDPHLAAIRGMPARAIAAGCKELITYDRQFWDDDWRMLADPFGLRWAVLEPGPERQD
jgi:PhnB protein